MRAWFAIVASVLAISAFADQPDSKSAPISFGSIGAKPVPISLGKTLKLDAEFKAIDVNKTLAVSVHGKITNPTDKRIYYSYQVAFLDKDKNLIGCQNFSHWADPGKPAQAGTFISLPAEQIEKIESYSVVFYESDKPIGSK